MGSVQRTIALISGANRGIGLATAILLAKNHGFHVIIGSRNADAGKKVASSLVADGFHASSVQLDLSSDESITSAVALIEREFGVLDVLINNAGILIDYVPGFTDEWKDLTTRQLFQKTFETNVIGTACLTEACLPLLRKAELPRVIFVSTSMGSLKVGTDETSPAYPIDYKAYDSSKAAVNMLAVNYARILKDKGGMVNAACPGLVSTHLTSFKMGTSPEIGAIRAVELATAGKGGPTATFSDRNGPIPW